MKETTINGIDVSESLLTATNNDVYYSQKAVDELQNNIKRLQEENKELKEKIKNYKLYGSSTVVQPCNHTNTEYDLLVLEKEELYEKNVRLQEENEKLKNKNNDLIEEIASGNIDIAILQKENEELKETINRLQKDCKRNNDLYMKEWDKNYKLSEISKEYNARRCIEKLYRLICDGTKSVQETYITLKDEVSEFLRIHKTMSSKYEEAKQTYKQALEEIREIAKLHQYFNPEILEIKGNIGQIQDLKMTEIYNKINEVLNDRD